VDPGLKIAGVTGQGVIASSWFRLRGNPKFFTLSNLLFSFFEAQKSEIATSIAPRDDRKGRVSSPLI